MPADLKNPFGPSCCDGGAGADCHESARPCGCDPGAQHVCAQHKATEQPYAGLKEDLHILLKRIPVNTLDDIAFEAFKRIANWSNS